jgi:hypothetical protein
MSSNSHKSNIKNHSTDNSPTLSQSSNMSSRSNRGREFSQPIHTPNPDGSERGKIVVCLQPRNLENNEIVIHYAQEEFLHMFGYDESSLPMKMSKLYGDATRRDIAFHIQNAILTRKSDLEYINLYRSDGMVMACHISLVSIVPDPSMKQATTSAYAHASAVAAASLNSNTSSSTSSSYSSQTSYSSTSSSSTISNSLDPVPMRDERWAVMTIRSASAVGNSKFCGIGLLGTEKVLPERLDEIGSREIGSSSSNTNI